MDDLELTTPGLVRDPYLILDDATRMAKDAPMFALFSGGHDSLTSTHIAAVDPAFRAVVHVNTGIGIEETREFVRDTCKRFGWPLIEIKAAELPDPQRYDEIVITHGFPGPQQHHRMYARLKERCLWHLKRQYASRKPFILCTGIRKQESIKRMGYAQEIDRRGQWIWAAPIVDWSAERCHAYMLEYNLPRNPVKDKLCISGECLCGAFAHSGERAELREFYPDIFARIVNLEKQAEANGAPCTRWGSGGPSRCTQNERAGQQRFMPLCVGCQL